MHFMIKNDQKDFTIFVKLPIPYDQNKEYKCYIDSDIDDNFYETKMKFPYDEYLSHHSFFDDPNEFGNFAMPITSSKWNRLINFKKYGWDKIVKEYYRENGIKSYFPLKREPK